MKEGKKMNTYNNFPPTLTEALQKRKKQGKLRQLQTNFPSYDFSSNDYLGFAKSKNIETRIQEILSKFSEHRNSSSSSRLIRGNYPLIEAVEQKIATYHQSETALFYNSGYLANLGLLSSINTKNTIVFYDELAHASIRDGLQSSHGKSFKFSHNNLADLERKILLQQEKNKLAETYVITEAIFSMDGDGPNLNKLVELCKKHNCYLIIDEAHSNPMFPLHQLIGEHELSAIFARIVTFGKGFGCHGAAILGSKQLHLYLTNFSRSFIYTTAASPHQVAAVMAAIENLENDENELVFLKENISQFRSVMHQLKLDAYFIESFSQIQSCIIPGNKEVDDAAKFLQEKNFDVRAIKSPTVPEGKERLRFCIHSFNNPSEIEAVLKNLALYILQLQ